jgi:hypothetical protein
MSKAYLQQTVSSVDPMADDKQQRGIFFQKWKEQTKPIIHQRKSVNIDF